MTRRPRVKRYPDGTPHPGDRCRAEVVDKDELFPRQCRKARLRGLAYCETHRDIAWRKSVAERVAGSYDPEVDKAARELRSVLERLV